MNIPIAKPYCRSGNYSIRGLLLILLLTGIRSAEGTTYFNASFPIITDTIAAATTDEFPLVGWDYNFYEGLQDPSLSSRCSSSYENAIKQVEKTVSSVTEVPVSWYYSASPPCCLNCTVYGGTVQVFYWPTPAPTPGVATLVDSAGFTFVSPSIYVAFQSLQATDLCGWVGTPLPETTIAFLPNELSTSQAFTLNDTALYLIEDSPYSSWSSFRYEDLQSQCDNVTVATWGVDIRLLSITSFDLPRTSGESVSGDVWEYYSYNPCSPLLSVPSQVFSIQPEWKSCLDGIGAFYDPPYALTPALGILQAPQTIVDPPALTTPAEVGQSPRPQTASATSFATSTIRTVFAPLSVQSATMVVPTRQQSTDPQKSTQTMVNSDDPPVSVPIVIGSQTISANSAGAVVVGSITLKAGAPPIIISNVPLSLGSGILVIASSTYSITAPIPSPSPSPLPAAPPVLTIGSDPITANPASAYIIGTQTLLPGGPAVAVSGTTYSLPSSSDYILVDGATSTFQALDPQPSAVDPQVLTLGSDPITANSASAYVIGTQTLSPGGPAITISGITYSLSTFTVSATTAYILVNGTTSALLAPAPVFTPTLDASSNALVLDPTQTLSVGEVLTYGSEVVSLATAAGGVADGTVIVVSGSTTETVGLGAWIAGGMGIQTTGVGIPFRGESTRRGAQGSWWLWLVLGMLVFAFHYNW